MTIEIEERLNLMGYAYFEDGDRRGRVFWSCDPVEGTKNKFRLSVSPSWGLPSDALLEEITTRITRHVQSPDRPPVELAQTKDED